LLQSPRLLTRQSNLPVRVRPLGWAWCQEAPALLNDAEGPLHPLDGRGHLPFNVSVRVFLLSASSLYIGAPGWCRSPIARDTSLESREIPMCRNETTANQHSSGHFAACVLEKPVGQRVQSISLLRYFSDDSVHSLQMSCTTPEWPQQNGCFPLGVCSAAAHFQPRAPKRVEITTQHQAKLSTDSFLLLDRSGYPTITS
jgi:hypothetical protein